MDGLHTNLNLDGPTPGNVQPAVGDWGPDAVPLTSRKRWARWWAWTVFVVLSIGVFGYGYWIYTVMTG